MKYFSDYNKTGLQGIEKGGFITVRNSVFAVKKPQSITPETTIQEALEAGLIEAANLNAVIDVQLSNNVQTLLERHRPSDEQIQEYTRSTLLNTYIREYVNNVVALLNTDLDSVKNGATQVNERIDTLKRDTENSINQLRSDIESIKTDYAKKSELEVLQTKLQQIETQIQAIQNNRELLEAAANLQQFLTQYKNDIASEVLETIRKRSPRWELRPY